MNGLCSCFVEGICNFEAMLFFCVCLNPSKRFGNVNKMQSLVQMCPVFPTSCHFCQTAVPQHMRVKDLGHQGQASVQGDELGFFGRALR